MENQAVHEAFEKLRPLCVQLTKEQTQQNVRKVQDALDGLDELALQQLQEYVLFPLRLILKHSQARSQELYIGTLQCMHTVLSQTEISRPEMFHDLFNCLCLMMSSPGTENKVLDLPEEVKLEVVRCLSDLANRATNSILQLIYTPAFLPALGHAVSVLLHLLQSEQFRPLRRDSLRCLLSLAQVDRRGGASFRVNIGNIFASYLPGIVMGVGKVITGDPKQGQQVTVTALETWYKIVCLVMGDDNLEKATKTHNKELKIDEKHKCLLVKRSADWVAMTTSKLKVLVQRIVSMATHSNWKVRQALVEWSENLLMKCTKSMEVCVPQFLEVLVSLVGDVYPNIGTKCKVALQKFQASCLQQDAKPLVEILEDNLHSLATRLPRLMRTADDAQRLTTLNLFSGYIKLLGPQVNSLLYSCNHLQRVSLALVQVLELDCSHVRIIQEKTPDVPVSSMDSKHVHHKPRKYFKHFVEERIEHELVMVCRMLGYYGDLQLLVDHFMDLFHQSSLYRKQAALVLNEVILGVIQQDMEVDIATTQTRNAELLQNLLGGLVEDYLSPEYFDLQTNSQTDCGFHQSKQSDWQIVPANQRLPSSIEEMNSNALQICLLLEGIGNCAKVMGPEGFQYSLMHVLYPVLEKLAADTAIVSETAYLTLQDICQACGYVCIGDLLCKNADYLVNSISLKLRHVKRYPQSPHVLQVLLMYSDKEILPLVDDTVYEVLSGLDQHYSERASQFMRVLSALTVAVRKWFPGQSRYNVKDSVEVETEAKEPELCTQGCGLACAQRIQGVLLDYEKQKRIAAGDLQDEEEGDCGIDEEAGTAGIAMDAEDDELYALKKDPPRHIKIVMEIMERCAHLVSAPDPRLRLLVLDTIAEACLALQHNTNELLPLVHKVWPPFALRFSDEEQLVTVKAVKTLQVMAVTSADFIRQRVGKDVLPRLCAFLDRQAPTSLKAGPAYMFTVHCKLQLAILTDMGTLCRKTDIGGHQLTEVMASCTPYLSCRQPKPLQEACSQTFHEFMDIDRDSVWLTLNILYCPKPLVPPNHPVFTEIKELGSSQRMEFTGNISTLLEHLDTGT